MISRSIRVICGFVPPRNGSTIPSSVRNPHLTLLSSRIQRHFNLFGALGRRRGLKTRGPVFAGPPKTVNFSDDKAGYLAAYLHNNPVRAGIVQNAADSTWTSHRAYIGLDPAPDFLRGNWINAQPGETR
jgi:hypothetical protein